MEAPRQITYDLIVVFGIFFLTDVLAFDFLPLLYLPSIILWALMPFVLELVARKGTIRNLGFQRTNFRRSVPLFLGLIVGWILLFVLLFEIVGKSAASSWGFLVLLASIFFHPALVEELSFRGFLQTRLERLISVKKALLLQAVVFGLYHVPPTLAAASGAFTFGGPFYPLLAFLFGLLLGAIYIKTRNLFVGVGFHASGLLLLSLLAALGAR